MNTRFLTLFITAAAPLTAVDTVTAQFASSSNLNALTAIISDCLVNVQCESGMSARPRAGINREISIQARSNLLGIGQVYRPAPVLAEDCAFVFPFNRWNWSGSVVSVTSGSVIGNYVAANTQLQQRSKILRMSSLTAPNHVTTQIKGSFSSPCRINSVCIVSHNMSNTATFRVRISPDAAGTFIAYDSGTLPVWEPSFTHSGPYEEEVGSDGTPSDELIAMLRYCGENPRTVRWIVFDEVAAPYIWIDFDDPDNPDDFIELAYVYVGLCIRAHPDQVYGWQISPVSHSRIRRSASGSLWTDVLYRQVMATATFASQPDPITLAFWSMIGQYLGRNKEFIIAFQPSDSPAKKFWYTMYGRFKEPPQLENISSGSTNLSFEVEELPG